MIREDDIAVMDHLTCQGPENLRQLLTIAEEADARQAGILLRKNWHNKSRTSEDVRDLLLLTPQRTDPC